MGENGRKDLGTVIPGGPAERRIRLMGRDVVIRELTLGGMRRAYEALMRVMEALRGASPDRPLALADVLGEAVTGLQDHRRLLDLALTIGTLPSDVADGLLDALSRLAGLDDAVDLNEASAGDLVRLVEAIAAVSDWEELRSFFVPLLRRLGGPAAAGGGVGSTSSGGLPVCVDSTHGAVPGPSGS